MPYSFRLRIDVPFKITRVTIPAVFPGRPKVAFVEFGDENAMKVGLEKHGEVGVHSLSFAHLST